MARKKIRTVVDPERMTNVEEQRGRLPINQYLLVIHVAATRGYLPQLDEHGKMTTNLREIRPELQLEAARYLTDKVMPTFRSMETELPPPDPALSAVEDPLVISQMSTDQLIRLAEKAEAVRNDPVRHGELPAIVPSAIETTPT